MIFLALFLAIWIPSIIFGPHKKDDGTHFELTAILAGAAVFAALVEVFILALVYIATHLFQ